MAGIVITTQHHRFIPPPFRQAARLALEQGWTISRAGSGHIQWRPPDGRTTVFTSSTPNRRNRAVPNCIAKLKRAGLKGI